MAARCAAESSGPVSSARLKRAFSAGISALKTGSRKGPRNVAVLNTSTDSVSDDALALDTVHSGGGCDSATRADALSVAQRPTEGRLASEFAGCCIEKKWTWGGGVRIACYCRG